MSTETKKGTTRLVPAEVREETLQADLESYRTEALALGASDAKIIPADWVVVDERVRLKCMVARCYNYGQCACCPPYTPEPEFMRKAFSGFRWAVLFKHDAIPAEGYTDATKYSLIGVKSSQQLSKITAKIESLAFADGYYLAMGFSAGSCRHYLCDGGLCQALDSGMCRAPLRARPSMEAVGINVFGLATKVGWDIYPIYRSVDPNQVGYAISVGTVFIH